MSKITAFPKGTIVKYEGVPCELLQDTPYYSATFQRQDEGKEVEQDENARLLGEIERLNEWVNDLQSGMYINCVYCRHRYGPSDEIPASMADALKQHIEQCPKHPMSRLRREVRRLLDAWPDMDRWIAAAGPTTVDTEKSVEAIKALRQMLEDS